MTSREIVPEELIALERQYWDAIKARNSAAAASLSDDPCVVVGAQGRAEIDRQALARMIEGAPYDLVDFRMDDVHVRTIADGVAIMAYEVSESLVVDGKRIELEAFDASVWVRRESGWVCALHTESLAGDPFGRRSS